MSSGLGIVWLVWAGCAILAGVLATWVHSESVLAVLTLAGPLALVAFASGLVDDVYGSSDAKGFKGHLRALAHGKMTTGGLKLIGIGLACLVVAFIITQLAPWGVSIGVDEAPSTTMIFSYLLRALVAGAAIALTSNFINLTDLRPGRALKAFSLLAVLGAVSTGWLLSASPAAPGNMTVAERAVETFALMFFVLGPVAAVWRWDLGEVGMLGDSGANPMGAVAGMLIVLGLPLWGLIVYALLMFGLNAASERVSYSRVIEAAPFLRMIDRLGRLPHDGESPGTAPVGAAGGNQAETRSHEGASPE